MATHNNNHILDAVRSSTNRSYCSISPLPPSPNASPTAFRPLSTLERGVDLPKATEPYSDPFVTTESDTFESSSTATAAALTGVSECGALMAPTKSEWQCGRRVLGKGSFGIVHLGINKRTGELCAVKSVTLENPSSRAKSMLRGLENEVHVLSSLSHPNIVRYLGFESIPDGGFNIFLEYVAGGSIAQLLRHFGPLHEDVVRGYVRQLLEGLSYLHGLGILHRDIKGGNMLVTERGVIKLSDFGSCKSLQEIVSSCKATVIGTVEWMSPEAITGHNVTKPSDLWSVGCTVIEMLTAETPWAQTPHEGLCGVSLMYWIATSGSRPLCPPAYRGGQVEAFLGRCLCQDPAERATVSDLLLHPWIEAAALPEAEVAPSSPTHPRSPTTSPVSQKLPQFTRPDAESDVPLILASGGLVSPQSSPPGLQQARAIFSFLKANAHQLESSLFPQQASSGSNSNSNSSSLSDQPVFTRTETLECSASGAVKLKQQERRLRSVINPVTRVADEWVLTDELESSHGNSGTPTSLKYTLTAKKGGSPLRANKRPGPGVRQTTPVQTVPRICEVTTTRAPRPVSASPPISISSDCDSAHALQLRREPSENTKLDARWKMFNSAAHQALQVRDNQISNLQSRMDAVDSQITSMQRINREGARLEVSYSPRPRTPKRRRRRDWDATSAFAVGVALTAIVAMVLIHRTKP